MFGKKKKAAAQPQITVWGADGETLYDGRLTGFCLEDATVKALSLRFFNDPEPCQIHRSAVLSRVFAELEAALDEGGDVDIDDTRIPRDYFSAYPNARRVRLVKG